MVGRQTPMLALFVPLILVGMVDGCAASARCGPPRWSAASRFAIGQFVCSNYISVELTDIVASLLSVGAMVAFLRVWQPGEPLLAESDGGGRPAIAGAADRDAAHEAAVRRREGDGQGLAQRRHRRLRAVPDHHRRLLASPSGGRSRTSWPRASTTFAWPGLDILNAKGEAPTAVTYKFNWLPAAGTLLLVCGLLTMVVLRIAPAPRAARLRRACSASSSGRR